MNLSVWRLKVIYVRLNAVNLNVSIFSYSCVTAALETKTPALLFKFQTSEVNVK